MADDSGASTQPLVDAIGGNILGDGSYQEGDPSDFGGTIDFQNNPGAVDSALAGPGFSSGAIAATQTFFSAVPSWVWLVVAGAFVIALVRRR